MSVKSYKIHILGPSGSGKGTQRKLLADKFHLPSVSIGEILRQVSAEASSRGRQLKRILDKGLHADNRLTNQLVVNWRKNHGDHGFIIEGYPRNKEQFDFYEAQEKFSHAIWLDISDKEVMIRITGRRVCPDGRTFHMKYNPPKHNETCDDCGAKLLVRSDSSVSASRARIRLFHQEMMPIIGEYKKQGILHVIDGEQLVERVHEDILSIFTHNFL